MTDRAGLARFGRRRGAEDEMAPPRPFAPPPRSLPGGPLGAEGLRMTDRAGLARFGRQRDAEDELAAPAHFALHRDPPAVLLHQGAGDGDRKSGSALLRSE